MLERMNGPVAMVLGALALAVLATACGGADTSGGEADLGPDTVSGDVTIPTDGWAPDGAETFGDGVPLDGYADVVTFPPCEDNGDCESGFCVPGPTGKVCAPTCVEECPKGWTCQQVQSDPDVIWICIWPHTNLCRPCIEDEECNEEGGFSNNLCLSKGGEGRFCGSQCADGQTCPDGTVCSEVASGPDGVVKQCVATGACVCSAQAIAEEATTDCFVGNGVGACKGTRSCLADGLSECSAQLPEEEACDDLDNDCDGETDEVGATGCTQLFVDADEDGFGAELGDCYCKPEAGVSDVGGDCDDESPATFPDAEEVCNGGDDDCDGETDEKDAYGCTEFFPDPDGDGYGGDKGECVCAGTAGYVSQGGDCDEQDPLQSPVGLEICNGEDDNCDGQTDPEDSGGCATFYADLDGDGLGSAAGFACLCTPEAPYLSTLPGDCDDDDPEVGIGGTEKCDGKDNDCDGLVDEENADGCTPFFVDGDLDGYGGTGTACLCLAAVGFSQVGGDCDDALPSVSPDGTETCNGIDDDCDGLVDPPDVEGCLQYYPDADTDLYGDAKDPGKCLCGPEGVYTALNTMDCDDAAGAVNPEGKEICDNQDNDCNGSTDEPGSTGCTPLYKDEDGDGFGDKGTDSQCLCAATGFYTAAGNEDCNDADKEVRPDAAEVCDGVDNDCDGSIDPPGVLGCVKHYVDMDGDKYGAAGDIGQCLCGPTGAYVVTNNLDCNDAIAAIKPEAQEVCDGIDNNCDGSVDPAGTQGCVPYYKDKDNDGYGDKAAAGQCRCGPDATYKVTNNTDCNDSDGNIKPGAAEACDGIDNNCDDLVDPAGTQGCKQYYLDNDNDGFGDKSDPGQCRCAPNTAYKVTDHQDCADNDPLVKPGATEKCDGIDNNCDGKVDPVGAVGCETYYKDLDGDGIGGSGVAGQCQCAPAAPFTVKTNTDCNDGNPAVPSCTAKTCGDDGCGGSCGSCGAGFGCLSFACKPAAMVRNSGTCPSGYTEAGKWYTGPGLLDGTNEGIGYEQAGVDAGWMGFCTLDANKYFVNVNSDDCGGAHAYLGCPAGTTEGGRFHVGRKQGGGPWCWQTSGEGAKNGTVLAGWLSLCMKTGSTGLNVYVAESNCAPTGKKSCPVGWVPAGTWHTATGTCGDGLEGVADNGTIDSGWMQVCAQQ
jgi:hypothetical protein